MSDINSKDFQLRLVVLDSGQVLLGQVMTNDEGNGNMFLYVMDPVSVWTDMSGTPHMGPWMPMSDDRVFPIPVHKILTVPTPNQVWAEAYIEFHLQSATERLRANQAQEESSRKETKPKLH